MSKSKQGSVFKGVYEFEDPGGCLLAARIPHIGSVDLYSGTAVLVRPNQRAFFIYKGEIADVLEEGVHTIKTENVPLLTRLANWRFGFKSPLRCELWFFSTQIYTARRWGTVKPVLHSFSGSTSVPIRSYGNCNIVLKDLKKFYASLVGSRSSYDISELDNFVQGQILELLPEALSIVKRMEELNSYQNEVSKKLQNIVNDVLVKYGVQIKDLQVLSLLPSNEVIKALDAKAAMSIIGNKQEYLLYQAANSLNELQSGSGDGQSNDPMQMMLGLMLGKSLMTADFQQKEKAVGPRSLSSMKGLGREQSSLFCKNCGAAVKKTDKFCSACGERQS